MPTYHQEDAAESNLPKKVTYPNGLTLSRIYWNAPDSDYWEVAVIKDGELQPLVMLMAYDEDEPVDWDTVAIIPKHSYPKMCELVSKGDLDDIRSFLLTFSPGYK